MLFFCPASPVETLYIVSTGDAGHKMRRYLALGDATGTRFSLFLVRRPPNIIWGTRLEMLLPFILPYQTYLRYLTLSPNLSQIHNQTTTLYKVVHSVILHVLLCVSHALLNFFLPMAYIERIGILVGGMHLIDK
jgi:hypothetical protein